MKTISPHCRRYQGHTVQDWLGRLGRLGRWLRTSVVCFLALLSSTNLAAQSNPATPTNAPPSAINPGPSVALNYSANPPLDELRIFDIVVVDGDHAIDAPSYYKRTQGASELFAYVAAGEALPSRAWYKEMPAAMRPARNQVWESAVIDQTHPDWPEFFVEKIVTPLWAKGYRGFFLDTMDSYQLLAKTAEERSAQEAGLVAAIKALKLKYPQARLIANRGFEVLPQLRDQVFMIAAESLFKGWNHAQKRYVDVSENDRQWLLNQLAHARDTLGMHALAIDYLPLHERAQHRNVAKQIISLGVQAYVTDPDLQGIGTGPFQSQARRILVLHNPPPDRDIHHSDFVQLYQFSINHLGYRVDIIDVNKQALPTGPLADRYAGVVTEFASEKPAASPSIQKFVRRLLDEKLPLLAINELPFPTSREWAQVTGLAAVADSIEGPLTISALAPGKLADFEIRPLPRIGDFTPVRIQPSAMQQGARPWLSIADANGKRMEGVAIMPWGGFVASSFSVVAHVLRDQRRWVINPMEMFKQALRLPDMPVPDLSTESGRRMLMIHIDGDGFASRAEIPGTPFAAAVMANEFIAKYPVPHTVSIIQAEVAKNGLYKDISPTLESIARRIFAMPHVELATHTFSHPFYWRDAFARNSQRDYNLKVPGYQFDVATELAGSARYVESLAPAGKKTRMVLWTGDCVIPSAILKSSQEFGLLNMNGGETTISRSNPSLTAVGPYSVRKDGYLQVFAPAQNENVYTNLWTGPFYGYEAAIQTFQLTEQPLRLKPINIYYHTYSASKRASIEALHKVYQYALTQSVHPIYGSEYAAKAIDWETTAVARSVSTDTHWRVVTDGHLQTARVNQGQESGFSFAKSPAVAGYAHGPGYTYFNLTRSSNDLVWAETTPEPMLINANGTISELKRTADQLSFTLTSKVAPEFVIATPHGCQIRVNDHEIKGKTIQTSEVTLNSSLHGSTFSIPSAIAGKLLGNGAFAPALVSIQCR